MKKKYLETVMDVLPAKINIQKYLECSDMLTCIPWNFLEHLIWSHGYDAILENSCVVSLWNALEYIAIVYV